MTDTDNRQSPSSKDRPMKGRAVEGSSYAEAWCGNCGWHCHVPKLNDCMDIAEAHAVECRFEAPAVIGQHVTLFSVTYPSGSDAR